MAIAIAAYALIGFLLAISTATYGAIEWTEAELDDYMPGIVCLVLVWPIALLVILTFWTLDHVSDAVKHIAVRLAGLVSRHLAAYAQLQSGDPDATPDTPDGSART